MTDAVEGRWARPLAVARRAAPWVSLAMGVASALLMNRRPSRAGLIAIASVAGWALLVGLVYARRLNEERLPRRLRLFVRLVKVVAILASEWQIQLALFFCAPFFVLATPWHLEHLAFLSVLVGVCLITLWNPLFGALLKRPITALLIQAFASFATLDVVLPILGLSNRLSLWIAALATAVLVPIVSVAIAREKRLRAGLKALAIGLLAPLALLVGGARFVPAVPLRLVSAEMGTEIAGNQITDPSTEVAAPAQLVCATVIWAPRGLKDELFHVWHKDGRPTDRIALKVEGGLAKGFHTFSIKKHFDSAPGVWSCTVETGSGQVLGERSIRVTASAASPPVVPAEPDAGTDAGS